MDEYKNNEINNPKKDGAEQEMPRFYFASELSDAPKPDKPEDIAPTPEPKRQPTTPTNIFGASTILNIPELKSEPDVDENEPTVDSIYDGPPKMKRISLILIPIAALILVLSIALTSILVVAKLNKPDRSNYLFDMMGLLAVKSPDSPTLWGFVNKDGELVIDYQFLSVKPFTEVGLAAAMPKGSTKWGYIDRHGDLVIDTAFNDAQPFDEHGIAVVRGDNHLYGMINEHGDYIVKPQFSYISPFNEFGIAYTRKNNNGTEIGLLRRNGFEPIDLESAVTSISPFSADGYAVLNDGRVIDKDGKIIEICVDIDASEANSRSTTGVYIYDNSTIVKIRASSIQSTVLDKEYFANGPAWACISNRYGYFNEKFEFVIDCKFSRATEFSDNGLACVQLENGALAYINTKGDTVISLDDYEGIVGATPFGSRDWAIVYYASKSLSDGSSFDDIYYDDIYYYGGLSNGCGRRTDRFNYINKSGELLFDEPITQQSFFVGDYIVSKSPELEKTYIAYDKNGDMVWQIEIDSPHGLSGLDDIALTDGMGEKIYDLDGNLIIDIYDYEYAKQFEYFHLSSRSEKYLYYMGYDYDGAETHHFVFDRTGRLVLGPIVCGAIPKIFDDGYISLTEKPNPGMLCRIDNNGEITELVEVMDYAPYSAITSYFESGRRGNRYPYFGGIVDDWSGSSAFRSIVK